MKLNFKFLERLKGLKGLSEKIKSFYIVESGGKKTFSKKRLGVSLALGFCFVLSSVLLFAPKEDRTYYRRSSQAQPQSKSSEKPVLSSNQQAMQQLFSSGERQKIAEQKAQVEKHRKRIVIKYFAPQILGAQNAAQPSIRSGSKLVGFLMNSIDSREPSMVRVLLPQGGENSGVQIEAGSVLVGQYSYGGSGDKIFINFHRLETASGQIRKITAQALDGKDYTAGVRAEVHSDGTLKTAAQIGLNLLAGMTDALTEKESLGMSQNGVQAKPTMKNGILQGATRAAQDQAGRVSSEIQSAKDYAILYEGKEMIIQLLEDYKKNER